MKTKILLITLLTLIACGHDSNSGSEKPKPQQDSQQADLDAGTYAIACFYNKLASQGIGTDVYSKSTMTLNSDGTGSNFFELFSDADCTVSLTSGTVAILEYKTVTVDDERVFLMKQDDGNGPMDLWIGYKSFGGNFYFDVDFRDGEAGPYLSEPSASELAEFMADPQGQGIIVDRL
jgi:hypothetical protein